MCWQVINKGHLSSVFYAGWKYKVHFQNGKITANVFQNQLIIMQAETRTTLKNVLFRDFKEGSH